MAPFPSYPQVIPPDAIDLTPGQPEFAQSFSDTVGSSATEADEFEGIFSILESHAADLPDFLSNFDGDLSELGAQSDGLGIPIEGEAVSSYNAAITTGQPRVNTFAASKPGERGRVFPGPMLAWLAAQAGQEFGQAATIDQNPITPLLFATAGIFLPPKVGDDPYPTKWWIRTPKNGTPPKFVRVELVSNNPVFERVWWDDFNAGFRGADWNFYLDINPVQVGTFCATVRLYEDATHYRFMTFQTTIVHNYGDHIPPFSCPLDNGGAGGGGGTPPGGTGGGTGGGGTGGGGTGGGGVGTPVA